MLDEREGRRLQACVIAVLVSTLVLMGGAELADMHEAAMVAGWVGSGLLTLTLLGVVLWASSLSQPGQRSSSQVGVGQTVLLRDPLTDRTHHVQIIPDSEPVTHRQQIHESSNMARALLGARLRDQVDVSPPLHLVVEDVGEPE